MRKRLSYLFSSLLLLAACSDENSLGVGYVPSLSGHYLHLSTQALTFDAIAGEQHLEVSSVSTPWQFEGTASWLTLSPERGDADARVTATAAENLSADDMRTSVFRFFSTDDAYPFSRSVSATQRAADPIVVLTPTALSFSASAGTGRVDVQANVQWTVSVDGDWLTASAIENGSQIQITVSENTTQDTRHAAVTVQGGDLTRTITITQAQPATPMAEGAELVFENTGGSYQLAVTSEVAWTASTSETWVELQPQGGEAGTSALVVSALPNNGLNDRTGFVYIHIGSSKVLSLPVSQKGIFLQITPQQLDFKTEGSSLSVHVASNTEWSVLEYPEWITLSESEGHGDADLTLTAAAYWGTDERRGRLRLGREGTALEAVVTLMQKGRTFDDLLASLDFGADAAEQTVSISTDGQWNAQSSDEWLTVTPASGTGETLLTVAVTDNDSDAQRQAVVTVTVGSISRTIAVTQAGRYFTIDPTTFAELPSKGGTHAVHIATNGTWTATSTSTWMKLSTRSGMGDIDVTLTVPDNPSIYARKDTTTFTPAYLQPVRVITAQAARYLTVGATRFDFFAKGGTSEQVTISTDAAFEVTASQSWLTVNVLGSVFTVTAEGNKTKTERQAAVRVAMKGLREGESYVVEIPVLQRGSTSDIDVQPFGDDQQWDLYDGGQTSIQVVGFASDSCWDAASSAHATVNLTPFSADLPWD